MKSPFGQLDIANSAPSDRNGRLCAEHCAIAFVKGFVALTKYAGIRPCSRTQTRHACRRYLLALLCFSFLSAASQAKPEIARIVGLGAGTCRQFNSDVRKDPAVQADYLAWAQGFMSGILLSRPRGVDQGLDLNPPHFSLLKQLEFLRSYCAENESRDFGDSVEALYKRLRKEGAT